MMTNSIKTDIPIKERVIFALDVANGDLAHHWIDQLESHIHFFKVGFELFLSGGLSLVKEITNRGVKVMLDLKLYDVPATVARTLQQLNGCHISLTTIHGDSQIIKAAVATNVDIDLLAVTILTSIDEQGAKEIGITEPLEMVVEQKAQMAITQGCAGVVASAREAQRLRQLLGEKPLIVSPGIRISEAHNDDQKRVATVAQAMAAGVDYMVIGRPIRDAKDPLEAITTIQKQIKNVLEL